MFAGWASFDNYLDGQAGVDTLQGGTHSDTLIFDRDDFQGQTTTLSNGSQINQQIYKASTGFDVLRVSGDNEVDFTGDSYQTSPDVTGNVISGVEAVVGDSANQTLTVNLHEVEQQSDTVDGADWQGFVAWLGAGDDTLNFTGVDWQYDSGATATATVSDAMINVMGLTTGQVADLQAFVFNDMHSDAQITVWTDADHLTHLGTDIF